MIIKNIPISRATKASGPRYGPKRPQNFAPNLQFFELNSAKSVPTELKMSSIDFSHRGPSNDTPNGQYWSKKF